MQTAYGIKIRAQKKKKIGTGIVEEHDPHEIINVRSQKELFHSDKPYRKLIRRNLKFLWG